MYRRQVGIGLCALIIAVGCQTRSKPSDQDPNVYAPHIVGRVEPQADGNIRLAWSATQITANFTGPKITMRMRDLGDTVDPNAVGNIYNVLIDHLPPKIVAMHPQHETYLLADDLGAGPHSLSITKRTEAFVGESLFGGFILAPEGRLLAPPPPKKRQILILGDSISAGYGNEGPNEHCHFSPLSENADLAYGPMAGRALDAEVRLIAWSGKGLIRNRDGSSTDTMPELYRRQLPSSSPDTARIPERQPDVVLINLGTNDFAPGVPERNAFEQAYIKLVRQIRQDAPQASLFLGLGPMLSDTYPPNQKQLSTLRTWLGQIIQTLAHENIHNVWLIEFPTQDGHRGFGCDWHPNLATHAEMATLLEQTLKNRLHW